MSEIIFVGETKIASYKATEEIKVLFEKFMAQFDTPSAKLVDDGQWPAFYATLTPEQKQEVILLQESVLA